MLEKDSFSGQDSSLVYEKQAELWLERWGINWKQYEKEMELGVEGPNQKLFDLYGEKILAEEWIMEYAIREYEKGRGLTVNEFLRMLINTETRPKASTS